jgi:hypothetical protein
LYRTALTVVSTQADMDEKKDILVEAFLPEQKLAETTANTIYVELQDDDNANSIGLESDEAVDELQKILAKYEIT